jgi:hypothetical protein
MFILRKKSVKSGSHFLLSNKSNGLRGADWSGALSPLPIQITTAILPEQDDVSSIGVQGNETAPQIEP